MENDEKKSRKEYEERMTDGSRVLCQRREWQYEYLVRVKMDSEGKTTYSVELDGETIYSVQGDTWMLFNNDCEPVRRFDMSMMTIQEGKRGEDIGGDGTQLGSFLRKVLRKLGGEEFEFPAQLFDVCLQNFFLHGETAMKVEVVGGGFQGDNSRTTAVVRVVDEAELGELFKNEVKEEGFGIELGCDIVAVKCKAKLRGGQQFDKNIVFELRRDDGDE